MPLPKGDSKSHTVEVEREGHDRDDLNLELMRVAKRQLRNAFRQPGDEDERTKYSILANTVKRLVGEERWRWSPCQAVVDVIRVALEDIPDEFTGRNPEQFGQQLGENKWRGKPERHIGQILYGYRDDELVNQRTDDDTAPAVTYEADYLPAARQLLGPGMTPSAEKLAFRVVRHDLARAILNLKPDDPRFSVATALATLGRPKPLVGIATLEARLAHQPQYERRPWYHAKFSELIEKGHHVIVLNGDRGNGKSRLALELIADWESGVTPLPYVFAGSVPTISRDARALLAAYDIETSSADIRDVAAAFAVLVARRDAPPWVVLDNVEDRSYIEQLIPNALRSVIVITSSVQIPEYASSTIEVSAMEPSQAVNLARQQLTEAPINDIQDLVDRLYLRPLPIVQVVAFIRIDNVVDIKAFLIDIEADAAKALDAPAPLVDRTLTALYVRTLKTLRERESNAAIILEYAACLAPNEIPMKVVHQATMEDEFDLSRTDFQRAVLELESRFLLARVDMSIAMHPLTQQIFRSLIGDALLVRSTSLHSSLSPEFAAVRVGRILDGKAISLLPHALKIIEALQGHPCPTNVGEAVLETCTALQMGCYQLGDYKTRGKVERIAPSFYGTNYSGASCRKFMVALLYSNEGLTNPLYGLGAPGTQKLAEMALHTGVMPGDRLAAARIYMMADLSGPDYIWLVENVLWVNIDILVSGRITRSVEELVACVHALLIDGQHWKALELVNVQRAHMLEELKKGSTAAVAEMLASGGKALLELGYFRDAETALSRAEVLLRQCDAYDRVRGIIRICALRVDLLLMSGAPIDQLNECEREAIEAWEGRPADFSDSVTEAHLDRIVGRVACAVALRATTHRPGEAGFYEMSSYARLRDAYNKYSRVLRTRDEDEIVVYDLEILHWLGDSTSGRKIIASSTSLWPKPDEVIPVYDNRTRLKILLLGYKILLIDGESLRPQGSSPIVPRVRGLVESFARYESAYWYAESLAVLTLMTIKSGCLATGLLRGLHKTYDELGRIDRWHLLQSAVEALLAGRDMEFRERIWFLVMW